MNFNHTRLKIGVFGSADGDGIAENQLSAEIVGKTIAREGPILCTGACHGLPYCAVQGANRVGGLCLGFSPAINLTEHINKYNLPVDNQSLIFTGMGYKGRNMICTRTCDAGIFIAGRWGTLNEFTFMCDEGEGKVIGLLSGSGGFVDKWIIPGLKSTDKKSKAIIVVESNPIKLIEIVIDELEKIKGE